jgi:exodeoxyribonuclease VII large subunit
MPTTRRWIGTGSARARAAPQCEDGVVSQPSFDLDLDDGGLPTFTVSELGEAINSQLRRGFYEGVWVRGEIQGWQDRGGHAYFSLVDDAAETKAVLNVQFFANVRMKLRPMLQKHRLRLGDGMKVRIHGYPDFYAPTGRLGLKMSGIDPRYTLGEIALARDELVRKLVAEGLYDRNRVRRLPDVPLRIGVVTSIGTAAWHDFVHELEQSGFGFHLVVADVRVQGDWAVAMVSAGLRTLSRLAADGGLDAVVLIRGGGARSELAAFDAEPIARSIAECTVPVLTGLGHEVDRSVADEVAHRSLKTPTACAASLVELVSVYTERAEAVWEMIETAAAARLVRADERLGDLAHRAAIRTRAAVALADERIVRHAHRLPLAARRPLVTQTTTIERATGRWQGTARRHLTVARLTLDGVEARIKALDPAAALARGWSITERADGQLVRGPTDVVPGEMITVRVAGGRIDARVERTDVAPGVEPDARGGSSTGAGIHDEGAGTTSREEPT